MKITFLGGADEVGANCLLLEIGGKHLLVDSGIRPSPKVRRGLAGDQLPDLSQIDQLSDLDAILVTHAHTDHTGALELITNRFPSVQVYATLPTITLTHVLHQDSRRIMQTRLDEEGELPLFDDMAVQRLLSAFVEVSFNARLLLAEGLVATFFPAGHIAGAAMIGLESDEGRLLITGDLSISPQRTVDGAEPPAFHPDVLIIESTYGGRLHANRAVQESKLVETVAKVTMDSGKVLIPAFALGRAQEILLILGEFQRRGELPVIPVWADGMVRAICQVYSSFIDILPLPLQERGAKFFEGPIRSVETNEQRNALVWQPGPVIIVSSSGMLAGGPSLSYARALASIPQHAILLTGYQDEESPGRRLQELAEHGSGTIRLGKDKVAVQCRLATYSLSAHADEGQLISLVETLDPEHILLVHGDEAARASLERALSERGRLVHLPSAGQTLQFRFDIKRLGRSERQLPETRLPWKELRLIGGGYYALEELVGRWLVLRHSDGSSYPACCIAVTRDNVTVETGETPAQIALLEDVVAVLGDIPPTPADLESYRPRPATPTGIEPNQALATANQHFPPEARLRKCGYRLAEHILILTFDFPDAARQRFAEKIASLEAATGWQVEVTPEANQTALNALAREVLPMDWTIIKSPAIHRELKRVSVTVRCSELSEDSELPKSLSFACDRFYETSGYKLAVVVAGTANQPVVAMPAATGEVASAPWEINAAYAAIRTVLEGSTLYRASLKGSEIMLSFISRQVGERYQEQIAALARQVGWRLSINPQPNQGAILEAARVLLARPGLMIVKGPSIYPEKAEVAVALTASPPGRELSELLTTFETRTGFRLLINVYQSVTQSPSSKIPASDIVEIPVNRIRLRAFHQNLALDPGKLDKAIERARRLGTTPPIQVRRASDGYVLIDGLYRLKAAVALGMDRIPAVVE
jgi:Cft2 family RNA processing exonuclease